MGLLVAAAACANNIAQDAHSGEDAKIKGAKEFTLDNGEGKTKDIVTYPGGDRVDWKSVTLPDGKRGTLDLKLTWKSPRPGLKLAFDVFDEYQTPVTSSKKKGRSREREASVDNAKGKYFIRVYAVGRGDAGAYTLAAEFKETIVGPGFDAAKLDIPDPPKLAAVPEQEQGCDEFTFDIKIPACKTVCPSTPGLAPPGWPPCKGKCPTPPTVEEPSCLATMPCPNPPDERVAKCTPDKWPPCPDLKHPDLKNPNCRVPPEPTIGRITSKETSGSDLLLTVGLGSEQGISKAPGMKVEIVTGSDIKTARPVPGGDVTIQTVNKSTTIVKTKLTADQITANPYVRFTPPPPTK